MRRGVAIACLFAAWASPCAEREHVFSMSCKVTSLNGALATMTSAAIVVAPDGNDAAAGTGAAPVRTLARAQALARAAKKDGSSVEVVLRGGTYRVAEPLVLTSADAHVTWRAEKGAKPVITGGRRVTDWTKNADGTWSASVPKGKPYRLLTVNGVRAVRCRAPNQGEFLAAGETERVSNNHTLGDGKHPKLVYDPKDIDFAKLADPAAGEIRIFHWWVDSHLRIGSVDSVSNTVTFAIPANKYTGKIFAGGKMCRYVAENFRSLLDEPGEWYLDAAAGRIDYLPRPGEDLARAEVLLAETSELMRLEGNPESEATRVRDVTFSGLVFADAHAEMSPKDPINDEQGSALIGAAIVVKGARNVVFEDCTFRDLGGYAIDVTDGSRDVAVRRSRLLRLGAGAVRADGARANGDPRRMTRGVTVEDCEIGPYGLDWASAVGVLVKNAAGCRIAHNRIHDGFYTAVSLGWSWGYGDSVARDNVVEWNVIEDIGKGLLNDMGGIYTLGLSPGSVIRGNVIRHVKRWSYGGHGLYQDEGSQGLLIEKNLVVDTPEPIGIHYAREITYRNNVIAFHTTSWYMAWCGFHERHVTAYFYDNIFYFDHGIPLGGGLTNPTAYPFPENPRALQLGAKSPMRTDHIKADWNVFFNPNGREERVDAALWDGRENKHSVWADPAFVDAARGDFGLKPDSPAWALGFEAVDWSKCGPRPRTER